MINVHTCVCLSQVVCKLRWLATIFCTQTLDLEMIILVNVAVNPAMLSSSR